MTPVLIQRTHQQMHSDFPAFNLWVEITIHISCLMYISCLDVKRQYEYIEIELKYNLLMLPVYAFYTVADCMLMIVDSGLLDFQWRLLILLSAACTRGTLNWNSSLK